MRFKKGLTGLLTLGALMTSPLSSKAQDIIVYPQICQQVVVQPIYPVIVQPQVIIVQPPVIIQPSPSPPLQRIFNTGDLFDTSKGQDLFVKYSGQNIYERIGEVSQSSFRIAFVRNNERVLNPQVQNLPLGEIKEFNFTINGVPTKGWAEFPRKSRDYNLHSVICDKESYDVYTETPNRYSETGKGWMFIGKINPGGDRLIFSDNDKHTCYNR